MGFGDDKIFEYCKQFLNGTKGYKYDYIFEMIDKYGRRYINSHGLINDGYLLKADIEDVLQEVQFYIRKNLVKYVKESSEKNVNQRNAYFNLIVRGRASDFCRKYKKKYQQRTLYYDSEEEYLELPDQVNIENDIIENSYYTKDELIYKIIKEVCEVNTSAEKIIAYLYTKVIYTLNARNSCKSGAPQKVSNSLLGFTYYQIIKELKNQFNCLLDKKMPEDVFSRLVDTITENDLWDCTFSLDVKKITDSNYIIKKKITNMYQKEKGELNERTFGI